MKKILRIILVLFLIYSAWLGIGILSYKQHDSTSIQDSFHEIQGVYHIHTTHSDGTKTPAEIAKIASSASIDFIILTDHGNPNSSPYPQRDGQRVSLFLPDQSFRQAADILWPWILIFQAAISFKTPTEQPIRSKPSTVFRLSLTPIPKSNGPGEIPSIHRG